MGAYSYAEELDYEDAVDELEDDNKIYCYPSDNVDRICYDEPVDMYANGTITEQWWEQQEEEDEKNHEEEFNGDKDDDD